jgi:Bacterial PH domain
MIRPRAGGVYRTHDSLVGAAIFGAGAVVWAVIAITHREVAGYVWAPLFALGAWRMSRLGAHVDDAGVKVVGFLTSRRIAWPDIDHFEVSPAGRYPYVGQVVRTSGRPSVTIMGISTPRGKTEKHRLEAQAPIDGLNDELANWRARHT